MLDKFEITHKVLEGGLNVFSTECGVYSANVDIVTAFNDILPQLLYLKSKGD